MTTHPPSVSELRQHLPGVNPAILLACLVSITGDESRLEEFAGHFTYAPGLDAWTASLPEVKQRSLEEWALQVLADQATYAPKTEDHLAMTNSLFAELASLLVGIEVAPESVPFMREQGGFDSFVRSVPVTATPSSEFKVAIIGAGLTGICMAVEAQRAGFDYVVLDRNCGVGGVWESNRYPGVGVDTQSKYYSFSFALNPDWTHAFPNGEQYRNYLARISDEYQITDKIEFNTVVEAMTWDETRGLWQVTYRQGQRTTTISVNAVVTAMGMLIDPKLPKVPGIDSFTGEWFHSGQWRDDVELTGKRVGVIGVGCTAVQIIDSIVDEVASLTVVQRQPHWIVPGASKVPLPNDERWALSHIPTYTAWSRLHVFLPISDANYEISRYDAEWAADHPLSISEYNHQRLQAGLGHLQRSFSDRPDLLAKMTPDYPMMGKRIVRDPGGYYQALKRDHVTVTASGLQQVTPEGIIDGDGTRHELDVIIYATGFTVDYLSTVDITGRDGEKLADTWAVTPMAYNGTLVPGFPNLFVTSGPNSICGHGGSHAFTSEGQVHYIIECLQTLVNENATYLDVTPEALERWRADINDKLTDSVWARITQANSYWRNANGDVTIASPLKLEDYWNRLRQPDLNDVRLGYALATAAAH